jgi:hypothetical protein
MLGCLAFERTSKKMAGLLAVLALIAAPGCVSPWVSTKATLDERAASKAVGGFSKDDAKLYHNGLLHLRNTRIPVGALMIGEIITQERAREDRRNDARATLAEERRREALIVQQERDRRRDHADDAVALNLMTEAGRNFNQLTGEQLFRGYGVDSDSLSLRVDGNIWEYLSHQDQDILKKKFPGLWMKAYCGSHGIKNCLGKQLVVYFFDLADNQLDMEIFHVPDQIPSK